MNEKWSAKDVLSLKATVLSVEYDGHGNTGLLLKFKDGDKYLELKDLIGRSIRVIAIKDRK